MTPSLKVKLGIVRVGILLLDHNRRIATISLHYRWSNINRCKS